MVNIPDTFTIRRYKWNIKIIKILNILVLVAYLILTVSFFWGVYRNILTPFGFFGILFVGSIDYLLFRWARSWKQENDRLAKRNYDRWGIGTIGELMAQEELESLPEDYRVISDFHKTLGDNIDFIIICPKGIFAIEVKANGGLIKYQDNSLFSFNKLLQGDPISQTVGNATYLSDLIYKKFAKRYFVQGILMFPRGQIDRGSIHGQIGQIWIGGIGFYKYVINKSQISLSKIEIEALFSYLKTLGSIGNMS